MKKTVTIAALLIAGLVASGPGILAADEAVSTSSSTPPKNLKKVGDHWTPWDCPAGGPEAYTIEKGDTFWDLAGKWLGDPHLWPQIWDQNRCVQDSHWIYPGDALGKPGKPTVVPAGGPPPGITEVQPATPEAPAAQPAAPTAGARRGAVPAPQPLRPIADPWDLYCSRFIDPDHEASEAKIVGHEYERNLTMADERRTLGEGDVVYINRGGSQGVVPGAEMAVLRPMRVVMHPGSNKAMGSAIQRLGKVRVLAVQENTSTAVITMSCLDINVADELIAWENIPSPMMASIPKLDRYDVTPSGGPLGFVVAGNWDGTIGGKGNVILTDLGGAAGAKPGSIITVFRENGDLPRINLGRAVVLEVRDGSSSAKLIEAFRDVNPGDRAELVR